MKVLDVRRVISGHREYFADFGHFTDLGAATMAGLIGDAVLTIHPRPRLTEPLR